MSAVTNAKAFRVSCEETFERYVDVIACAEWQAIEIARQLRDNHCDVFWSVSEEPIDIGNWKTVPLKIGGQP